jgi:hypothetical protein
MYGTAYADREAVAERLQRALSDPDPRVRGWIALAVARLTVPLLITSSHPILAEGLRRGAHVDRVSVLCGRLMEYRTDADAEVVVKIAALAAGLRTEAAALAAIRVLQGLRLPEPAQTASAPFVAVFLHAGFGPEEALRLLASWPPEARQPALAEVEKLRSHDDWRMRRMAGGLTRERRRCVPIRHRSAPNRTGMSSFRSGRCRRTRPKRPTGSNRSLAASAEAGRRGGSSTWTTAATRGSASWRNTAAGNAGSARGTSGSLADATWARRAADPRRSPATTNRSNSARRHASSTTPASA